MSGWSVVKSAVTPQGSPWSVVTPADEDTQHTLEAIGSGAVRTLPQTLDLAGAATASMVDQAVNGSKAGDYFKGFMQPRQTPANDLVTAVFGPEYQAKGVTENVAKFIGGVLGPGAASKVLKNGASFVNTLRQAPQEFITDPDKLRQIYTAWDKGLEDIGLAKNWAQKEVVDPFLSEMQHRIPTMGKSDLETVEQVKKLGDNAPNARAVEGLRKNLSGQSGSVPQAARQSINDAMARADIPQEGRDAYRRLATVQDFDAATQNLGVEPLRATRNKISKMDVKTPAEKEARDAAARSTLTESALRGAGRVGNTLMSGATTVATGNPVIGVGMYGTGRGFDALANKLANNRINNFKNVIINGRPAPDIGEKVGLLVRSLAQNPSQIIDLPANAKAALIKALGK